LDFETENRSEQSDSEKGNGYNSAGVGGARDGFFFFFFLPPKKYRAFCGFFVMGFETWNLNFGAWEILGYGFQDMVFKTWDLNFGAWIFTPAVSKTET
jgi:hypothetical protein